MPIETKVDRVLTYLDGIPAYIFTWRFDHMISNLKSLHLHYHSAYSNQIWQAGNLPWAASSHNITPTFGQVILRDHVTY